MCLVTLWRLRRLSFEGSLFGPGREAKLEPSDPSPAALQTIGGRQRVGRRCAAPSEPFHFRPPAARRSRSEESGLYGEQKLLYIILHPKHWVSAAGAAVGQSYGREKRMVDLSEAGASVIGGPTFMRMQEGIISNDGDT